MICHPTIEDIIDHSIGNVDSSSEDLVQVATQLVGNSALVSSVLKLQEVQLSVYVVDVIVKVITHDDSSICILFDDILDDISYSFCSLCFERFVPRFEVAIQYLHLLLPSCHPCPAEIGNQRFDKRCFHFVGCCCPCPNSSAEVFDGTNSCRDTQVL